MCMILSIYTLDYKCHAGPVWGEPAAELTKCRTGVWMRLEKPYDHGNFSFKLSMRSIP